LSFRYRTPIEKIDANTQSVFGDYIGIYDIQRALEAVGDADKRIDRVAGDFVKHWAARLEVMDGKAMLEVNAREHVPPIAYVFVQTATCRAERR
jgi:type I site-specific restriction-modification system R (restriction) subunit